MNKRIAFIGTGLMGAPIVRRMTGAGLEIHAWNRDPIKLSAVPNAIHHARASDAVQGASLVFLCLTDDRAVQDVLFGDRGIAAALPRGATIIDMSTIGPGPTRTMAERLFADHGCHWIDAPLTGGVAGAEAGTLIALCGGDTARIEAIQPIFTTFTKRVSIMGPLGAGQAAKLCNQLIVSINILAMAEALELAEANGIAPERLPVALAGGWADSLPFQIIGSRMAAQISEPPIGAVATFAKDMRAALTSASAQALDLPLAQAASALYGAALDQGLGPHDPTVLARLRRNK